VIPSELGKVLEATGYLEGGRPAPGVRVEEDARSLRRGRRFAPDALWRGPTALTVYFKYQTSTPAADEVAIWRREIWNEGFAPLLWVVSPKRIDLYNGFARPQKDGDADANLLHTFRTVEEQLKELDELAGRLAMETGQFWASAPTVNRKTSVDQQLLSDLAALERDLVRDGLDRASAQGLIGRAIFTQYLIDRRIVDEARLKRQCQQTTLAAALRSSSSSSALFQWLSDVFNGDMFPASMPMNRIRQRHFSRVADFLEAIDSETGQTNLFPYQFDIIPVELISSIYEQFAHAKSASTNATGSERVKSSARSMGVHYTRLPVVSLVLDEVMNGLTGNETVLDLTCGSGVFLVEALRRLVMIKAGPVPNRQTIRSTLYNQICGVDISDAAIRVAAFSLYLAAIELDPDPQPPEALKFKPLIGTSLIVGDAKDVESTLEGALLRTKNHERKHFDVIVGNPPWTFKGKKGTAARRKRRAAGTPLQPRGEGFDFVLRATEFAHETTRYGIVLSAMPFFAGSKTGAAAAQDVIRRLSPATLVNLAPLTRWLFPTAKMPAVALLARCRPQPPDQLTIVNVPWSPAAERSHTFEIAPSDITTLPLASWATDPKRLKTLSFGRTRDLLLLDELRSKYSTLSNWLTSVHSVWRDGLIMGKPLQRTRSARHLHGLEFLQSDDLLPFEVPPGLPTFGEPKAQWPRERKTYEAPLLLIKEFLKSGPRPITAVADRDIVYTDAYFGVSLGRKNGNIAHLLAAILSSSLATWFFLMTAAEYGVWKRRLFKSDVGLFPIPDPSSCVHTDAGRKILALEKRFRQAGVSSEGWAELDHAVFELYHLESIDCSVPADGLLKASWQWKEGREYAAEPANFDDDLLPYANTFLADIEAWLQSTNKRRMRAEVFKLPLHAPLRVIRFVLEDKQGPSAVQAVDPSGDLAALIGRIGDRLGVPLSSSLVGERELRVHGKNEVVIIKPAARRFWMRVAALEDADSVVAESFAGAAA
jgi:hypothetical protein